MPGLDPAIHVFPVFEHLQDVDARHKAGHDGEEFEAVQSKRAFAPRGAMRPGFCQKCPP